MKYKITLLTFFLFIFSFDVIAQEVFDFQGSWYYDFSEIKIIDNWVVEKATFDFSLFDPIDILDNEKEDKNLLQLEPVIKDIPLLIIDEDFQYLFGSVFDSLGKLNLFVKKSEKSIMDYSEGDLRFQLIKEKEHNLLKIFNDDREEYYKLINITNNEMIIEDLSTNNKIHFKRI